MAKYSVEGDSITLIKNAIAAKTGDSGTLTFPNDFADAVGTLPPVQTGTSKTYTPGASEQSESFGDSIHVDSVTVKAIPSSYIVPSGSKSITANGTHDVTSVASAVVSVPVPSGYLKYSSYYHETYTPSGSSIITSKTFSVDFDPYICFISMNTDTTFSSAYSMVYAFACKLSSSTEVREGAYKLSGTNRLGAFAGGMSAESFTYSSGTGKVAYSHGNIGFYPGVAYDVYIWGR